MNSLRTHLLRQFKPIPPHINLPRRTSSSPIRSLPRRPPPPRPRQQFQQLRFSSSSSSSSPSSSISSRLKQITRDYGWAAVGVYLALSAADFPICYLLVRSLGVERIGEIEGKVVGWCKKGWEMVGGRGKKTSERGKEEGEDDSSSSSSSSSAVAAAAASPAAAVEPESEIQQASKAVKSDASLWTQLVLAYAIHKSVFIFVRVPLTAAITPKVVKTLRSWGWNIGRKGGNAVGKGGSSVKKE